MYQNNKKTQRFKKLTKIKAGKSKEALCLICFKPLGKRFGFRTMIDKTVICDECLSRFELSHTVKEIDGIQVRALYEKNDFIQELYQRYAYMYDYALKDAFIIPVKKELKNYRSYQIVTIGNEEEVNQQRMYDADLSIAQCFGRNCLALYNDQIIDATALRGADVLLFAGGHSPEDVKTAIRCLKIYQPHQIAAFLLFF